MSLALSASIMNQYKGLTKEIVDLISKLNEITTSSGKVNDWDEFEDKDIQQYNEVLSELREAVDKLKCIMPAKVHICKNCGNIFFSDSNFECCNTWDPTGKMVCTTSDIPAPYKTWKCPPRRVQYKE